MRSRIWEVAEELFAKEFYDSHEENITRPTRRELRKGGYFHQAKCMVLRDINRTKRGAGGEGRRDEEDFRDYINTLGSGGEK